MLAAKESAALFIDGANLYAVLQHLKIEVDFKEFLRYFKRHYILRRAYYYTALPEDSGHSKVKTLVDWLDFNGFTCVTKAAKIYQQRGATTIKGNMDIEIALDVLRMAPHVKHIHLFSGDGDFTCLVREIQNMGIRVMVYSTMKTDNRIPYPMISHDLRKQADEFVELADWIMEQGLVKTAVV